MIFKDFIHKEFPEFYLVNDTYPNQSGDGLFKRYCQTLGLEFDEEIIPYIKNFMDIIDYQTTDDKYLPYIGYLIGAPQVENISADIYRKILNNLIYIFSIKGTENSFKTLFNILGYTVSIETSPTAPAIRYDQLDVEYDTGKYYDVSGDINATFIITIFTIDGSMVDLSDTNLLYLLNFMVCFLKPIDAIFVGFSDGEEIYELNYQSQYE